MPVATNAFKQYLKSEPNMKMGSNAAVNRFIKEGINTYLDLADFDKASLDILAKNAHRTVPAVEADAAAGIIAEPAVPGTVISTVSMVRIATACEAVKYYIATGRVPDGTSMHYANVLVNFKVDYEAFKELKKQDAPDVPDVKDNDGDRKIIKWLPIFFDCMSRKYGVKGPVAYVLRENVEVPDAADDPLLLNSYYGMSGSLQGELLARLPHGDALYRSDNKTVYMCIEKACRGTSVESTVKAYSRSQDGRGAYMALRDHHAGDSKYRAILKARTNLLTNIKWNARQNSLEKHVSNHRQAHEDLQDCSTHITVSVAGQPQRVEWLLDSISSQDPTLQATIGLIRSDVNNMRNDFEKAAAALIEVDPYSKARRPHTNKSSAQISAIDFASGRGGSGVDLRWHTPLEFKALSHEQRDDLVSWQKTPEGKATLAKSRESAGFGRKRSKGGSGGGSNGKRKQHDGKQNPDKQKKWLKRFAKKPEGLKHIMSLLADRAEGEKETNALISALTSATINPAAPAQAPAPAISSVNAKHNGSATVTTLNSILKNGGK
jgi:hypothetical protein